MKVRTKLIGPILFGMALSAHIGYAAEKFATAKEAEAMVAKVIHEIKAVGTAKTYADITNKKYSDRDLYPVVYDLKGVVRAHGQNPKMVGKDLLDLQDADGKAFVKERVELAQTQGKFWQDYKFTDPVTKKILPKSMYCEKQGDTVICAGIYKR